MPNSSLRERRKRLLVLWSVLIFVTALVVLYAWLGELVSPGSDYSSQSWGWLTCGSLADISNYTKHAVPDGNNPPWSGYDDSGPTGVDIKMRDGCLNAASAAQTTLIVSGAVEVVLVGSGLFVVVRRKAKPRSNRNPRPE
jgi:hypothetical protein